MHAVKLQFSHLLRMAKQFGCDEEKAYLAGLLHDCAKYPSKEQEDLKMKEYNFLKCLFKERELRYNKNIYAIKK